MTIDSEKVKSIIAELGYNSYVQKVVSEYFLLIELNLVSEMLGVSPIQRSAYKRQVIMYYDDLNSKQEIENRVIPFLHNRKNEFILLTKE